MWIPAEEKEKGTKNLKKKKLAKNFLNLRKDMDILIQEAKWTK